MYFKGNACIFHMYFMHFFSSTHLMSHFLCIFLHVYATKMSGNWTCVFSVYFTKPIDFNKKRTRVKRVFYVARSDKHCFFAWFLHRSSAAEYNAMQVKGFSKLHLHFEDKFCTLGLPAKFQIHSRLYSAAERIHRGFYTCYCKGWNLQSKSA